MRTLDPVLERPEARSPAAAEADLSLGFLRVLAGTMMSTRSLESECSEPRDRLSEVLFSDGPRPGMEDKLSLFAPLVGSWDLDVTSYPETGEPLRHRGEWHFGWALEGRAIVDVWISPARGDREDGGHPGGDYGMSVRFYDPALDAWRSTWIGPMKGLVRSFIACASGVDGIVLEGSFSPGVDTRWMFSEIRADSFRWQSFQSHDAWKTRRLWQEMRASRRRLYRSSQSTQSA